MNHRLHEITDELFKDNEGIMKFYTGLPNWTFFNAVPTFVSPCFPRIANGKLSVFQMVVMFFMKIRLNLYDEDIGHRFGVHRTTVSRSFHKVLNIMEARLSHLMKWPDR